ncbi:MAG: vitamin K epoxide reductase family protein [Actinomycetota bacterium]|nr:vitamin K epoxide reductase family protein [Actinomycetota bacterium]
MGPEELSEQLREGSGEFLERRRKIARLALLAAGSMGVISLYQLGVIKHLPDPPLPGFDSDRVDASEEAYSMFQMPDGPIGLGSYAATLGLAAMGGKDRAEEHPFIPLALAAKVAFDALQAGKLTVDQITKHRALCSYCLVAAGATFATVPLVLPEARAALRALRGG